MNPFIFVATWPFRIPEAIFFPQILAKALFPQFEILRKVFSRMNDPDFTYVYDLSFLYFSTLTYAS